MAIYYQSSSFPIRFEDPTTGEPLSGGSIEAYVHPGSTPKVMYKDADGTSIGTSVTLNSAGYPEHSGAIIIIWLQAGIQHDFVLKNSSGSTVWTSTDIATPASSTVYNNTAITGDGLTAAINRLAILYRDFETDSGGSRTLTAADFGVATTFTHASAITLTVPADIVNQGDGPCIIHYPQSQLATITIAAADEVTLEQDGAYNPGALIAIYRVAENEFKVGGA